MEYSSPSTEQIIDWRNRFKKDDQKAVVVKELSHLPNAMVAEILNINDKYWSRVKSKYGCNYYQLKYSSPKKVE